ncbi:MAG: hypothetical protein NUW01_18400 [Gemmatimonadaceae bacterium]|nr:hypothetical protein [Gemmatimonadaceae bacterium]
MSASDRPDLPELERLLARGDDLTYGEGNVLIAAIPPLLAEVETLREKLIRCAELAGADGEAVAAARSGALKHPTVAEFAVASVLALRQDYDDQEGAS